MIFNWDGCGRSWRDLIKGTIFCRFLIRLLYCVEIFLDVWSTGVNLQM